MTTPTPADFAAARFAEHPDGRTAVRIKNGTYIIWNTSRDEGRTDQNMAEQGWRIVTPALDPSDPDVIEQAAIRARDAYLEGSGFPWETLSTDRAHLWRDAARAALTPLPARDPEAEKLEAVLRGLDDPGGPVPTPALTEAQVSLLADLLTEHGVRVGGGEG